MRGKMLWFNGVKDAGVITLDSGERVDVDLASFADGVIPQPRCAGLVVELRVTDAKPTRKAHDVAFVEELAPRRARLRHAGRGGRA